MDGREHIWSEVKSIEEECQCFNLFGYPPSLLLGADDKSSTSVWFIHLLASVFTAEMELI